MSSRQGSRGLNAPVLHGSHGAAALGLALLSALFGGSVSRADIITLQDGVNGYSGTRDTFLRQASPTLSYESVDPVEWDGDEPPDSGSDTVALLRFRDIIGPGPNQIPIGSSILSATLTYNVINSGNTGQLRAITIPWGEFVTWDGFGDSPGVQAADYAAASTNVSGASGMQMVDVSAHLAAWAANPGLNYGWLILPTGTNGVEFNSRESAVVNLRPKLVVSFVPGGTLALIRQPYLQRAAGDRVTIAWRTNFVSDSRVRYGDAPGNLTSTVDLAAPVTNHFVELTGLTPGQTYYYEIGSTTQPLVGGDVSHQFTTSPAADSTAAFTAWIVGDSGEGGLEQTAVRDAMLANVSGDLPEIFLHVGDMAYESGTDFEFTVKFFSIYQDILRRAVCWPVIGNHEGASSDSGTQSGPYYDAYMLPMAGECGGVPSGTEAYYSFDYGNTHFIALDSHDSNRSPGGPMLTWLNADLAANDSRWTIAFWHHPPYSKGSHDSDDAGDSGGRMVDMRQNVLPILEAAGVDLVFSGHSHIYERSWLVQGAYDTPTTALGHVIDIGDGRPDGDGAYLNQIGAMPRNGTVYVVSGHGGRGIDDTGGGHPLMYFDELDYGSCLMTIDGNTLSMVNVRHDGVVSDRFTIIKLDHLPGDLDNDLDVDSTDVFHFVQVLLDLESNPQMRARSDLNDSGAADGDDIGLFINVLFNVG